MPVKLILRLIGFALVLGGGFMAWKTYNHTQSAVYKASEWIANSPPRSFYELLIPTILLLVVGLGLLVMPIRN